MESGKLNLRFSVCSDTDELQKTYELRKKVYCDELGYDIPIPDPLDDRSLIFVAEDMSCGKIVGSMRMTPKRYGPLEWEEYFPFPENIDPDRTVETTRYLVDPSYRKTALDASDVSFGLFKVLINVTDKIGCRYIALCSKEKRVPVYEWLFFKRTGQKKAYPMLNNTIHELLVADLADMKARPDHMLWDFVFNGDQDNVDIPDTETLYALLHHEMA